MIVSLNGVIQAPISSFTVSGSTITFAANLVTGDDINFIQILGDVLDLGVPSDGTVSTVKLATNAVTTVKITDANVTSGKIANDAVTLSKMASGTDGNIISYDTSGNPIAVATGNLYDVLTSAGAGAVPSFQVATVPNNAITLAKMASGTDGNIISYDTSGNPVAVATGSSGQVLTSAGAGAVPSFQAASGGANTPYFFAYRNSSLTTNTETLTTIPFDTEDLDSGSGFNTSTGAYTIPSGQGGKYFLSFAVQNDTVSAGTVDAYSLL